VIWPTVRYVSTHLALHQNHQATRINAGGIQSPNNNKSESPLTHTLLGLNHTAPMRHIVFERPFCKLYVRLCKSFDICIILEPIMEHFICVQ
jgi:hypothetical protein